VTGGELEVRVDLLVELERARALTATALTLTDPDLPYAQYEAVAVHAGVRTYDPARLTITHVDGDEIVVVRQAQPTEGAA
jgi:hypothetical protein